MSSDEPHIEGFSLMYKVKEGWVAFYLASLFVSFPKFDIKTKAQRNTVCPVETHEGNV